MDMMPWPVLRRPTKPEVVALWCGLSAFLAALITQWAAKRPAFHPSLLLNVSEASPMAEYIRAIDPGFHFVSSTEHYDGVYFYAMALDPFAMGQAHTLIDLAAYRYGHPLYSWVAAVMSAGQVSLLPWVFWLMSLGSMFAAGFFASRLVARLGGSPWWGLAVAMSPGLLYSSSTALTEPAQVALTCAVLLWLTRPRSNPAVLAIMVVALCLLKEQLVLVPVALAIAEGVAVVGRRRLHPGRLLAFLAGPLALGAWLYFVRNRFDAAAKTYDEGNIDLPLRGWFQIFDYAAALRERDFFSSQIGTTVVPGIIAIAVVLTVASVIAVRRRDALSWVVLLQAAVVTCLGWRTLMYPHEMFRIPAVALVLAVLLIGVAATRPVKALSPDTTDAQALRPGTVSSGGTG
ncbi:AZOBR_p60025 family cell surface glycopolymer formation protein [Enemella sp. A6]|uniref:AZOBR_p60025 family cell surface glycopolymer formation protein n=1 Tax=Enemella sp. A6 TaxID=3440152 RepID=UPI003EB99368